MRIAIIGAGFGGMAAAYDLRKSGHEVVIFEAADYVGGTAYYHQKQPVARFSYYIGTCYSGIKPSYGNICILVDKKSAFIAFRCDK